MTPFDLWAAILKAPFSGDVQVNQEIQPRFWSSDLKGIPEIEDRIQTEVASFGKQLGKIIEALLVLSHETGIKLNEIEKINAEVAEVKKNSKEAIRAEAVDALERLRKVDEGAWRQVIGGDRA